MSEQEPRRHHYIPQFILKNFTDENGQVNFWDIERCKLEKRNTKSVFMDFDMYRDEVNHSENPTIVEKKFAIFENEIATLISAKILRNDEIVLTRREVETLRIFTTLMSFRSKLRMEQYQKNAFNESTRQILLKYQPDGDFENLWKRELDELAGFRTYEEITNSEVIDSIIKQDFLNDIKGFYLSFVDARGGEFLLSDVYPTLEIYPTSRANLHLHYLFPLSSNRMMMLNHIMFKPESNGNPFFAPMIEMSKIKGDIINPPTNKYVVKGLFNPEDLNYYKVRKMYSTDLEYINALLLNESRVGIIFSNKAKIEKSVKAFNLREDTKQKYLELEKAFSEE